METIDLVLDKVQIEDLLIVEDQAGPQLKRAPNIIIVDVVSEVVVVIEEEEEVTIKEEEVTMEENPGTMDRGAHIKQR